MRSFSEAMGLARTFTTFANTVSRFAGRPGAFVLCIGFVIVWALTGPLCGFSDTWQLIINTSTTIITFLMVFLIQNTQNRDNAALQAKLDELIRMSDADNSFIGIEHLTDKELEAILERCEGEARALHEERRKRGKRILARAGAGSDLGDAALALLDQEDREQVAPRDTIKGAARSKRKPSHVKRTRTRR